MAKLSVISPFLERSRLYDDVCTLVVLRIEKDMLALGSLYPFIELSEERLVVDCFIDCFIDIIVMICL